METCWSDGLTLTNKYRLLVLQVQPSQMGAISARQPIGKESWAYRYFASATSSAVVPPGYYADLRIGVDAGSVYVAEPSRLEQYMYMAVDLVGDLLPAGLGRGPAPSGRL